ncbi:MAG: 3-deoxy-manno-octulosonate cytidylyltransferase [Candidatus Scalindua rubra]|uniref:3-deoxy-manno-octulosonate cytidylyltransferase n=1 Tax=Candidatus Scalindua rubra TaxID=1872076 RepID=A0A1E3XDS5_9BACT|nr:MAG: 3-deoxy-manno-octulosonate cytidylyltransferase [Candidatus Scalindua rubra]
MIGAFIVARIGSTRLPGKNMMILLGKPMIELMVERVKSSRMIDKVVIAISTDPTDGPLENLAKELDIGIYRGSLENVMERVSKAAEVYNCDTIIELLGDNPLVHCDLIDDVVRFYLDGKYDYAATVTNEYPVSKTDPGIKLFTLGVRVQVYSRKTAEKYVDYPEYFNIEDKGTTAYIFEHPETFKIGYFEAKAKWSFMNRCNLNFAINYYKNFNLIRTIFEKNYPEDKNFTLEKVYEQLDKDKYLYLLMGNE